VWPARKRRNFPSTNPVIAPGVARPAQLINTLPTLDIMGTV
jgi:hypothetical protein